MKYYIQIDYVGQSEPYIFENNKDVALENLKTLVSEACSEPKDAFFMIQGEGDDPTSIAIRKSKVVSIKIFEKED